jgi:hypothetical protein
LGRPIAARRDLNALHWAEVHRFVVHGEAHLAFDHTQHHLGVRFANAGQGARGGPLTHLGPTQGRITQHSIIGNRKHVHQTSYPLHNDLNRAVTTWITGWRASATIEVEMVSTEPGTPHKMLQPGCIDGWLEIR